jgi:site-specific recombinase XerD
MLAQDFKDKVKNFLSFIEVERGLTENTLNSYKQDLTLLTQFWMRINSKDEAEHNLTEILERYFIYMHKNGLSKSSIARKVSCIKSFEKFMQTHGISLGLSLKRPRLEKKLPIYLSVDEMFMLLEEIKPENLPTQHPLRDMSILELLYATGIRCSELVNIKIKDINFAQKTILIQGKGRQERIALFGNKALNKMQAYIHQERAEIKSLEEPLFLNNRDGKLSTRAIQRTIKIFRQFLKISRPITPHKIRHTFATHLLNQGVDLRVVQELLGHKSLSSTEKYTHVTNTQLARVCENLHPINEFLKRSKK